MPFWKLNRIIAGCVLLAAMLVYALTLAPTVVFWDVGEFIAAAKMMQVPHPPGSPLFLLVCRVAMMVPFAADQAVRAHALSALLSAVAIGFTYLVFVKVLVGLRGIPRTLEEKVIVFGPAVVGALGLAFSTTYWDNSIEAEVYGASMFFLSAILWLVMRWQERADQEGSERYFLISFYLIGLSLGVHLLALLAIFPMLMIAYFKKYEVTPASFVKFWAVAAVVFFVVYPGIVKYLPGMMDGEFAGTKSQLISWIPWIIIAGVSYWAYTSYRRKQKILHVALLSIVLILLGYTTYIGVLIRSNTDVPMNENDPNNLARLTAYLGREQYGEAPLFFPRRYSQEAHQQGIYTNYKSDWDFMLRYQLSHMFFRYMGWNFIGSAGDEQDSGVSFKDTLGIPFFLGLIGLWYLFKKDWKVGLVFLTMFVIFGPVLALYQNQQEPQPRERDYFYVGAYYVFCLWIAVGIVAVIDYVRKLLKEGRPSLVPSLAIVTLAVVAVPVRLLQVNWHEHDRSGNYVAWDYSYNILQTCEKDAILFTNGDNDTFPLWYLQDVEGVRRDIRIVNLSLINTPWYIKQMKDKPYYPEAKAVPISLSDARIANIAPEAWQTRDLDLPVPNEAIERYGVTDTSVIRTGKIRFTMPYAMQVGRVTAIRTQDILVRDIIFTNQWKRPIYFAVTVAPDSKIGLDPYLWFHGLAWRMEPRQIRRDELGLNTAVLEANLFNEPADFSRTPAYGYKFRKIQDTTVYFDENTSRLMVNYRSAFLRLAMQFGNFEGKTDKAIATLERMEKLIPESKIPMDWALASDLALFYYRLGRRDRFDAMVPALEQQMKQVIASGQYNVNSYYNPYRVLLEVYEIQRDYVKTFDLLKGLAVQYPDDPGLKQRIAQVESLLQRMAVGKVDTTNQQTTNPR
jgi:hypothetical protein